VKGISETTTPIALRMESLSWLRQHDPGLFVTGIPDVWIPVTWGGTASINPSQLQILLWPKPTGVILYTVDAHITVGDLVMSADVPLLPYEYHWLLIEAGCYEEWIRKADTRAGTARQDMETGFKEMRHWVQNPADYQPTNAQIIERPSRLGGMFPSW
jgi:hypothetical protein